MGNTDGDSINTNRVLPPFHARYVRVHPQSWNNKICLRLEMYGCESTGKDEGMVYLQNYIKFLSYLISREYETGKI